MPDVEQHEVGLAAACRRHRLAAAVGLPDLVPEELQQLGEALGRVAVVVDEEHAPRARPAAPRRRSRAPARGAATGSPAASGSRTTNCAPGAAPRARGLHAAAVQRDQLAHEREPDAEARRRARSPECCAWLKRSNT